MYNASQRSPIYIISISTTLLTQASFSMLIVQARKIVEDVPGVDEAEIHLELADESKLNQKNVSILANRKEQCQQEQQATK